MKKTILLFSFLCCLLGFNTMNAQAPSMVLSPLNQCFSASGTTATAYISSGFPGATSFSWAAVSDSCVASITSYSNGGFVSINYPCCGNYTIICAAFNGSVAVGMLTQTASISCNSGSSVSISGANSTCNGASIILTGSGSTSYTWMPGGAHSASIAVTPTASTCYTLFGTTCSGISAAVKCVSLSPASIYITGTQSICAGYGATLSALGASNYTWYTSQGTYTGSTIVLTPSVTSCYSVVATTSTGCTAYSGGCITVGSGTSAPVISGNLNVCQGSSTSLYASGAGSYTWLPGGSNSPTLSVISPSATTCYTLMGSGCSGISSAVRCVTVNAIPVLSVAGNTAICAGNGSTLVASGAASYTWYTTQGTFTGTAIVLTPTATACYTLAGRSSAGCMGYTAGCINVSASNPITVSGTSVICAGATAYLQASGSGNYTWTPGNLSGDSIAVTPTVSTCYYVYGTSTTGCISSGYKCVTVQQSSSVSINGLSSICSGSYVVLYASGGSNYTWSPGGSSSPSLVVSPTTSACYTLSGLSCSGISSAVKCISVSLIPTLSVSGSTSICSGSGATLVASGASYFTWYTSQGTFTGNPIVLSPTATTCYSLAGYNSAGCAGYSGGCITVSNSTSLTVSGATALCAGMSTTLTASGAQTYTWFPSGYVGSSIALTPTATTCYTLVGYSATSCGGITSKVVCVTVSGSPFITTSSPVFCAGQSNTLHASGAASYTWYPYNLTGANVVISPSVGTCYTVVGTSSTGCTGYATGCYSVIPGPTVSVTGSNLICAGASTTLTAIGAQSYTWYPSNQTGASSVVNPLTPICYTVAGTLYGCTSYAVKCLSVQTGPTLTTSGNTVICGNGTTTLSASGASSYTWLPGNLTGASIVVSPTASTCYTVVGTHSAGCVGLGYRCVSISPNLNITLSSNGVVCAGSQLQLHAAGATSYTWLPYNISDTSIVISPSVSNCYTVIGSNAAGCTGSAAGCFSVIPAPSLIVSGNSSICAGASTSLIASGASTYTWYPGNSFGPGIVVSPSVTTCYTVTGSNGFCKTSVTKCVNVQSGAPLNISGANLVCTGTSANLLASGAITYTWNNGSNSPFITVTPTAAACYTVSGTTSGGCIGSAVKCISVQATPFIFISGPGQVCSGTSAILTATGASSYVWSNGTNTYSTLVVPYVTTVYSVTGSNGVCSSTKAFTVVANPRPSISIFRTDSVFSNDSTICNGDAVNLYASGATSYTWSTGNTLPYITVFPTGTTNYTVSGTNAYGCSNSNFITIYAMACTGLSKNAANPEIGIYPNPSSGKLVLQGNIATTVNYKVVDMLGRELLSGEFTGTKDLNLSSFANGTYIIRFESGAATTYKKLVLENR